MISKSFTVAPLAISMLVVPSLALAQVAVDPGGAAVGAEAVAAGEDAIQVMEQGPVHEAFAEPVVLEAAKGIVVDRAPPEPVNELPPDVKPAGNNVQWISGYWMWSDRKNDFIWVSGVWRDIPPGRRWVPGHWLQAAGKVEWVPGFWADEAVEQVDLLPTPPETLEAGPTSPAPGDDYFWVPGCWVWQSGNYVWRTGYWYVGQPNWVWVPDHYCYTSYGAYFVNGYWDYPLVSRGLLYAPVYWTRPIYARPGYFYRPYRVVNSALLLTALFVNPYHSHYYYGYGGWGSNFYRPWWSWGWGGRVYDPFYSYHRWHDGRNRHDWHDHVRRDWDRHHHDWDHDHDRDHGDRDRGDRDIRDGRGPRSDTIARRDLEDRLVTSIDDFRRQAGDRIRLEELNQNELQRVAERSDRWQQIREARTNAEANAAARAGRTNDGDRGGPGVFGREGVDGAASARAGASRPDGERRLRIGDDGSPRASFRLPQVERSGDGAGQAITRDRVNVPDRQGAATTRARDAIQRQGNAPGFLSTEPNRDAMNRRFNLPSSGQIGGGQNAARTLPGRVDTGRLQLRQGDNNLTSPGAGNRVDLPRSTAPGRNFNSGQGAGNQGWRSDAIQQRAFRVPSGGGSNIRVPSGDSGRSRIQIPSGGGSSSIRIPSGGGRNFSLPSGGSGQRSFGVPSRGGQRSFSAPSSGGRSQSIRVPSGDSNFRGFSGGGGGGSSWRSSGGGGGGQQMFRGSGGGGNRGFRGGGGGSGNRGGGRGRN